MVQLCRIELLSEKVRWYLGHPGGRVHRQVRAEVQRRGCLEVTNGPWHKDGYATGVEAVGASSGEGCGVRKDPGPGVVVGACSPS
jgi:hypothetical protein